MVAMIRFIVITVAYFLSARLGLMLAFSQTNATPVWPATGIALALCLLYGQRIWPGIFLGAFLANLTILDGSSPLMSMFFQSLSTAAGNTLEAIIGALLIRRVIGSNLPFGRTRDAIYFILFGSIVSTSISAFIGVTGYCLVHGEWSIYGGMLLNWWLGDSAGALIFTPVILTWSKRHQTHWNNSKYIEILFITVSIIIVETLVFLFNYPLQYLIIPLLLWFALRFGQFEVTVVLIAVMGSFLLFTIKGFGPFTGKTLNESLLFLQSYISVSAIATLLVSSLMTEHRETEDEIIKARQQLYDIIDFLPDATFAIDREGRVIAWNRAIEEMTGTLKKEILDKGDYAYAVPFYGERKPILIDLVAMDESRFSKDYDYFNHKGHVISAERYINILNRYVFAAASLLVGKDGIPYGAIESIRDISERKQLEQELVLHREQLENLVKERTAKLIEANDKLKREIDDRIQIEKMLIQSEDKYRNLVEGANSIIMRWSTDGRITFFNTYAQNFFGYGEQEIIGKNIENTIVPPKESTGRNLSSLAADIAMNPEAYARNVNENIRKNGERVWVAWANKPIFDEKGQLIEILSVGNDITKLKVTEAELRHTLEELAIAKEQAEVADNLKSAFLATMSHELRTPLNSIIGFTGIILQGIVGPLNDEQKKQLNMVRGSAQHLLSLINDVLDISKIEAKQLQIANENYDLRSAIEKTVESARPLAGNKGLELICAISPKIQTMTGDRRRVEQILLNLISNAIKFTEKGSVKIECEPEGNDVTIRVIDTGIGIKMEDMETVFQDFRQIDSGMTRKYDGTGLGLSICKRLVGLMGGDIRIVSEWQQGTTFIVTIPAERSAP